MLQPWRISPGVNTQSDQERSFAVSRSQGEVELDKPASVATVRHMPATQNYQAIRAKLFAIVQRRLERIQVEVTHSERWNRPCATFTWSGFAGLLPEERFQRLARVIPEEFRNTKMAGFVWLELAPGESLEQFLALPRSEDVADREDDIYRSLVRVGFFRRLAEALSSSPEDVCAGDFAHTVEIIDSDAGAESGATATVTAEDAKLTFIRLGVYCDCQVNRCAEPAMSKQHAGAA